MRINIVRSVSLLLIAAALTTDLVCAQRRPLSSEELQALSSRQAARLEETQSYLETNRFRNGLNSDHTFKLASTPILDELGTLHARFDQLYKGIPIRNAQVLTHLAANGQMLEPTSYLYSRIDINTTPAISREQAVNAIWTALVSSRRSLAEMPVSAMEATVELQIHPELETVLKPGAGAAAAGRNPNADDHITRVRGFRLVYAALVSPTEDAPDQFAFPSEYYLVDAATGRILRRRVGSSSDDSRVPKEGIGYPIRRKEVKFWTTRNDAEGGRYELYDLTRGSFPGNTTRSNHNSAIEKHKASHTISSPTNSWGNNQQYSPTLPLDSETAETPAVDVAWGLQQVWDLLKNIFNHAGIDGNGTHLRARVHFDVNYTDAKFVYKYQTAYFGDGVVDNDPEKTIGPNISLSTVSHEVGHGLWSNYLSTDYDDESEAKGLNEGHGDIMGAITNFYANVSESKGSTLQYSNDTNYFHSRMYNPPSYPPNPADPPFYNQTGRRYWQPGMATFEEHVQGCAYGHMFVMLVEGASNDSDSPTYSAYFPQGMGGIGLTKAAKIWFFATTKFAPKEPTFSTMRDAWVKAATYLYGNTSVETNAVTNAWAAINVGEPAKDNEEPTVSLSQLLLDEREGSLIIVGSAGDDTGVTRVEAGIGDNVGAVRTMAPYRLIVDVSTLNPGVYTAFVRAFDRTGKSFEEKHQFLITGAGKNQVITNGSFESGSTGWTLSGASVGNLASAAFLGNRYLRFNADAQTASQKLTIPANASDAKLSIRYRVLGIEYLPGENLFIDVKDESINKIYPIAGISSMERTLNDAMRHYKRLDFDLTALKGKPLSLQMKASLSQSGVTRFVIDAVSVTYTLTPALALTAESDEPANILRLRGTPTNINPDFIKSIQFRINGQTVATDTSGLTGAVYNTSHVPNGTYQVQAFAIGLGNNVIVASPIVPITFTGKTNLLKNGAFEQGKAHWTLTGLGSTIGANSGEAQLYRAQSGKRFGHFFGPGPSDSQIRQIVAIPKNPVSVTVSFYLKVMRDPGVAKDASDVIQVGFLSLPDFGLIVPIHTESGDSSPDPAEVFGYTKVSYTLTQSQLNALRGKTVALTFRGIQKYPDATHFYIDDVAIYAPTLGVSN